MWIEFGPTLGTPLEPRIKKRFPELQKSEIDSYSKACKAASKFGHKYVYDHLSPSDTDTTKLSTIFSKEMKAKFDWLNDKNLSRLFSQGCYYSMK